jgi:hypothetical protein
MDVRHAAAGGTEPNHGFIPVSNPDDERAGRVLTACGRRCPGKVGEVTPATARNRPWFGGARLARARRDAGEGEGCFPLESSGLTSCGVTVAGFSP